MKQIGTWIKCNPNISHPGVQVFFKKKPEYKYPFCDLCLFTAQKRNGTLPISNYHRTLKNPDSKPEKDSL